MSRKGKAIFAIIIILAGVILFNYPTIATFVNNIFADREINSYKQKVHDMSKEKLKEEMQLALAYNQSLPRSFPADPFTKENIRDFTGTKFEKFDMVQMGNMIGYIEVPSINIYLPVYYGTSNKVLDKGLGLLENTSLPVGGPGTHAVISGHTGMASKKIFTDLDKVKKGELFFVHVLDKHFAYKVDQIKVVLPENVKDLQIVKDKDLVTLVTCTPFGINDHRLLVRGARTPYDFSKKNTSAGRGFDKRWIKWILILGAALVFMIFVVRRARKNIKEGTADGEKTKIESKPDTPAEKDKTDQ